MNSCSQQRRRICDEWRNGCVPQHMQWFRCPHKKHQRTIHFPNELRLLINHAILDHALQLPVRTSVVIDIIEERTWFADVIDLDDKDWRASAMSYEVSRLNTSPPAFSHYTMAYYAESSDDAVRQSISRFIAQAAVIRTNLEVAYRRR